MYLWFLNTKYTSTFREISLFHKNKYADPGKRSELIGRRKYLTVRVCTSTMHFKRYRIR